MANELIKDIIVKGLNLLLHDDLISDQSKYRILFIKTIIEEMQVNQLKKQLGL